MFSGFLVGRSLCLICLRLFLSRERKNKSSVKGLGQKIGLNYLDYSYKLCIKLFVLGVSLKNCCGVKIGEFVKKLLIY